MFTEILFIIFLIVFLSIFCFFASGIIHELGHVITGLLHGWEFYIFIVGPIGIKKNENRLQLYFEKDVSLWGGAGGTFPSDEKADNMKILSRVLLAGPIASITAGFIFLLLGFIHFNMIFLLLGAITTAMGIGCLLPLKTGIMYSDGKRWSRLHGEGQGKDEEIALYKMMIRSLFKKDASPLEYDDFAPLLNAELPAIQYYGYYYLYEWYSIRNDEENKQKTLEKLHQMKKNVPKIIVEDCEIPDPS